jgi:hypothetical protein
MKNLPIPRTTVYRKKIYLKYFAEYSSKSYAIQQARRVRKGGNHCIVKTVHKRYPGNLGTETLYVLYYRRRADKK